MKKFLKKLLLATCVAMTIAAPVSAQFSNSWWYKPFGQNYIKPQSNLDLGASADPIGDIYAGTLTVSGFSSSGNISIEDDNSLILGTGSDASVSFRTGDPNANKVYIGVPTGSATETPVVMIGEEADKAADHGFLDGETEPALVILDASATRYAGLQWGGTFFDFISDGVGTQFRFQGPINFASSVLFGFSQNITYGTGNEGSTWQQSNSQGTGAQGATLLGLGSDNYTFILTGKSTIGKNHDLPVFTNPTEVIFSATDPDTANDQYVYKQHDQTRAKYISGKGSHSFGTCSPTNMTENPDDMLACNELEVKSNFYATGSAYTATAWYFSPNSQAAGGIGKANGGSGQTTAHVWTSNNNFQLVSNVNRFTNHNIVNPGYPVFLAHSTNGSGNEYVTMGHNETDSMFQSGKGDFRLLGDEAKGQSTNIRTNTESVTFAANPGDASKTTSSLIPDGAVLLGVTTRVTTAATNCTSVNIGDGTDVDMFGATTGITQNTTTNNSNATAQFGMHPATSAQNVTVTAVGGNCYDGVWAITAHYIDLTAATSN